MLLRFSVQKSIFLYGFKQEDLDLSTSFAWKRYRVTLGIVGGEVRESIVEGSDYKYWRQSERIEITLDDEGTAARPITELCTETEYPELLKLIHGIMTRVLRVVRNAAFVPEMPETIAQEGTVEEELRKWDPEVSDDGGVSWRMILPELPPLASLSFGFRIGRTLGRAFSGEAEMYVGFWDRIEEMLQDGKEPSPEQEFFTNTVQHLRAKNYRLALLEAIIGLEIVLAEFLSVYLSYITKTPEHRIETFLSPEQGLTTRLSALLDLTLHESYLKDIDFDKILKAVTWRNKILHRTGRLPPLPEETIRGGITAVTDLAKLLAERREDVKATPEKEELRDRIRALRSMGWPRIWIKPWHKVHIELEFWEPFPSKAELQTLTDQIITALKTRDNRFDPERDLVILFKKFAGGTIGRFMFGVVFLESEPPPKRTEN